MMERTATQRRGRPKVQVDQTVKTTSISIIDQNFGVRSTSNVRLQSKNAPNVQEYPISTSDIGFADASQEWGARWAFVHPRDQQTHFVAFQDITVEGGLFEGYSDEDRIDTRAVSHDVPSAMGYVRSKLVDRFLDRVVTPDLMNEIYGQLVEEMMLDAEVQERFTTRENLIDAFTDELVYQVKQSPLTTTTELATVADMDRRVVSTLEKAARLLVADRERYQQVQGIDGLEDLGLIPDLRRAFEDDRVATFYEEAGLGPLAHKEREQSLGAENITRIRFRYLTDKEIGLPAQPYLDLASLDGRIELYEAAVNRSHHNDITRVSNLRRAKSSDELRLELQELRTQRDTLPQQEEELSAQISEVGAKKELYEEAIDTYDPKRRSETGTRRFARWAKEKAKSAAGRMTPKEEKIAELHTLLDEEGGMEQVKTKHDELASEYEKLIDRRSMLPVASETYDRFERRVDTANTALEKIASALGSRKFEDDCDVVLHYTSDLRGKLRARIEKHVDVNGLHELRPDLGRGSYKQMSAGHGVRRVEQMYRLARFILVDSRPYLAPDAPLAGVRMLHDATYAVLEYLGREEVASNLHRTEQMVAILQADETGKRTKDLDPQMILRPKGFQFRKQYAGKSVVSKAE